jgi:phosphoribosyl 1,2-cyclic phosphodiesterase
MSLFISSLNSGSNGNCYYIGSEEDAILVDAGISCRETEKRLSRLGLDIGGIRGIFVSHEHKDHISGIQVLSARHRIPVYITEPTLKESRLLLKPELVRSFEANKPIVIGNLQITGFSKFHDAIDPYSFVVEKKGIRVGVFTDIGIACEMLTHYFSYCHAAFLEANYDEEMLDKGSYPFHLKKRIRGGMGHLSNTQALALVQNHKPDYMSHLLLSHLSQNNNCPDLVAKLFAGACGNTKMAVASRFEESEVFRINPKIEMALPAPSLKLKPAKPSNPSIRQLSLFI